jgi:Zn-dependent metalloprotease
MKKISSILVAFFLTVTGIAQTNLNLMEASQEVLYGSANELHFVRLKESTYISVSEVDKFINSIVFKNGINKVVLQSTSEDGIGFTHMKYAVYQNGIELANKVINAHCKNGHLISLNGDLVNMEASQNGFSISEKSALKAALVKVNAKKYKWENKEEEAHMREALNQADFTYSPVGKKIIFEKEGKLYSAYQFNIYTEVPLYRANVFVNASNGKILDEQNLICNADVPGTAVTKYSGTQPFTCDQNGSNYRLRETQRGMGIETYNLNNGTTYTNTDFNNSSPNWTNTGFDQGATDAHWGAEKTYDYYLSQHNRNSINNAGFKLLSYIHYGNSYQNAFWDGQRMTYGDGVNGKIFTTLDICGHEITHGLTSNTGNMTYQNESGALNESYSDIFAACIENYARPTNWNWKMGEDLSAVPTLSTAGFRSMSSPNLDNNPDTYGGTFYYTGTQDNGGVHINSGVSNYWFYLLTTGGSGTNDLGNAFSVTGIGMTNAARIAFRALTVYYTPSTNFATARNLSIQAAKDLFGTCSVEVEQTTRAWYAVGVGANYSATNLGVNFAANGSNFCSVPASVSFSNSTNNGLTYTWNFGDGTTATGTNAAHSYTAPGVYSIKLKAIGCANVADSLVKNAYITVNGPVSSPLVSGGSGCENNTATLTASGSGTIKWYDNQFGGTLLGVGNSFVTPTLNASTSFYAENSLTLAPIFGGRTNATGGGYSSSSNQWLNFNVSQPSVLQSVVVYALNAGNRVIELRSAGNIIISSVTESLSVGANTVILNYNLLPGTNFKLALGAGSTGSLYRSTSGTTYPYNIGSDVSITGASTGAANYVYFYNWKIQKNECASARFPALANVNPKPAVSITAPSTVVCIGDQSPINGIPLGGTYSGNNLNVGSVFNPSLLGTGDYTIVYAYTDNNGCSDSSSVELRIEECTGLSNTASTASMISIYPNPSDAYVVIKNEFIGKASHVLMSDASGRVILDASLFSSEQTIDLSQFSKGMYLLTIKEGEATLKTVKLIKE